MAIELKLRSIEKKILAGKELDDDEREHVVKKVNDYWEGHPDVTNRYPRWKKFIAWVAGYQSYDYNKLTKQLVQVPVNRKRKLVFNRIRTFVRTLLAKLAADVPQAGVIPKTSDDDDIEAARVGDKVIEGLAEKLNIHDQVNKLRLWLIICNRGYLRVFWNKEDYGILGYTQEAILDEDTLEETGEMGAAEEIPDEGDVCIEAISPFNCRPDPLYHDRKKWRWFLYGEEVDASELEEEYDLKEGTLVPGSNVLDDAYTLDFQDEQDIIIDVPTKDDDITGRTTVLKEFWTPNIFIFVAGKKLLDYGLNEYGTIPFFPAEERLVPIDNYEKGFTYNESLVKDAIPIQREYNRFVSIMSLALERASKLKILTPLGSLMNKKQWTNDYGVFIDYNPKGGQPPFQAKMDTLPQFMPQFKTELEREFEVAFGAREASFGRLPERASHASGTLVNLLLEQDDVLLNPLAAAINRALSEAWSLALKIVQDNYGISRLVKYMGEDGSESVLKFKGSDLQGNTDVRVVSQTGLPKSRALRIEYIMQLRAAGLLTDDKATLEMLEFGNAEKIFKDNLVHEKKAYRENRLIEENPEITPKETQGWLHPLEDSMAHLKIHMRDRFGVKFENKYTPEQQQTLDQHLMQTYQVYQQMMMQMQQAQAEGQASQSQAQPQKRQAAGGEQGGLA